MTSLRPQIRRSLAALPLLALGLVAVLHEPPRVPEVIEGVVSAGLACGAAPELAGPRGLARMPGDLGLLARRLHCSG